MSDFLQYTILTLLVAGCGLVFVAIGVGVNKWESARARRQFTALASQYSGVMTDAHPLFGAAPLSLSGTYNGQPFRVETRITSGGRVNIGGVMTPVQGVVTLVRMHGAER